MQWLIVPRHPQRFDTVAALVVEQGLGLSRRSQWVQGPEPADVWLGDSLGEMARYYGLADVALLGGSFAPLGGQNLIEAAACGCPVLLGPSTFNFAEAAELAIAAGAACRVADMSAAVSQALAWLKLTDTKDPDKKIEAITSELQDVQGVQVTGGIIMRQQIQQILNIVLAVVIGLLAASVLVAIVGISNTLGLSVLERTRESALLRALGLTRAQLRGMFGIEAMVLAGVGVLLGIGLGIGYGIAGSLALLSQQVSTVVISVPWLMLLGILAFGLGAGWLASVLPSVKAGKVQPAAALAAE